MTCREFSYENDMSQIGKTYRNTGNWSVDLAGSISKLLKSGAKEEDIDHLIGVLSPSLSIQQTVKHPIPVERPLRPPVTSFLEPFSVVGKSWLDWGLLDEPEINEKVFMERLLPNFTDRARMAQVAFGDFGKRLNTLGQLCDNDAQSTAAEELSNRWSKFSEGFGSLAQVLGEGVAPGNELIEHAKTIWTAWCEIETTTATVSQALAREGLADTLEGFSVQLRLLRYPLQGLTSYISAPLKQNPAMLFSSIISFAHANLAIVRSMGFVILASVRLPPVVGRRNCTQSCPHLGCTDWCTEDYTGPICSPWRRIVGPIGGPSGIYHRVCRWIVRQTEESNCCCYRSRWDRFWASNPCFCWTERGGPATVLRNTQEWSVIVTTPPAATPPPPFQEISIGNC